MEELFEEPSDPDERWGRLDGADHARHDLFIEARGMEERAAVPRKKDRAGRPKLRAYTERM